MIRSERCFGCSRNVAANSLDFERVQNKRNNRGVVSSSARLDLNWRVGRPAASVWSDTTDSQDHVHRVKNKEQSGRSWAGRSCCLFLKPTEGNESIDWAHQCKALLPAESSLLKSTRFHLCPFVLLSGLFISKIIQKNKEKISTKLGRKHLTYWTVCVSQILRLLFVRS